MKKLLNLCFIFILLFSFFIPFVNINAEIVQYAKLGVLTSPLKLRSEASTTSSETVILTIPTTASGTSYKLLETVSAGNGCVGSWYKIQYDASTQGYVCSDIGEGSYIDIIDQDVTPVDPNDFSSFPESYRQKLADLKEKYPKWTFEAVPTGLDFWTAAYLESKDSPSGSGLIDGSNEGWRSTSAYSGYDWENDSWIGLDGSAWKGANKEVLAYFMDPRNFLNESEIFQFEELYSNPSIGLAAIQSVLNRTFMSGNYIYNNSSISYASTFYQSGIDNNVNPVFLATRVKQEVVLPGGSASGSASGTVPGYEGYYNFFNINAYSSSTNNAVINGLIYAKSQGWDSPYKSITQGVGGVVINNYIKQNAQTRYFQKYNVNPKRWGYCSAYYCQYMTNIRAAYSEGNSAYNAYNTTGGINSDSSFHFLIPVFDNMPDQTTLPNPGNPNYYLKDLRINGETVPGFSYDRTTGYFKGISTNDQTITIDADTINSNATVTGTGVKAIEAKENNADNVFNITVTAENGKQMTYTINIVRENPGEQPGVTTIMDNSGVKYNDKYISGIQIGTNVYSLIQNVQKVSASAYIQIKDSVGNVKTNDSFKTGDTVTISSNNETKNYTVVIYGDLDGDGEITRVDLLLVQRQVFGYANLDGIMAEAANVDKQGSIDRVDLLLIQRKVFGYGEISQ